MATCDGIYYCQHSLVLPLTPPMPLCLYTERYFIDGHDGGNACDDYDDFRRSHDHQHHHAGGHVGGNGVRGTFRFFSTFGCACVS